VEKVQGFPDRRTQQFDRGVAAFGCGKKSRQTGRVPCLLYLKDGKYISWQSQKIGNAVVAR